MRNDLVRIPTALQLCLDDVAWHNGQDERTIGRPSRSGLPRKHAPEDYRIVNEVGRAIGMKILCPLCLGEWDKDNLLRGEIGITYDPDGWNRAAEIDYDLAAQYFEAAEEGEYLEYAVHGLLHGNYDTSGRQLNEQEYFVRKQLDGRAIHVPIPMEDIRRRLDLFQRIYEGWGFQKHIRSFVSPGGIGTASWEELSAIAEELRQRGYLYWTNGWYQIEDAYQILNGVCCMRESGASSAYAPWNAFDFDPTMLPDFCSEELQQRRSVFGMHWTNFLRYNPARNMEYLEEWVRYFKRQSEIFGVMLSQDIAFSANQLMYCCNAKVSLTEHPDGIGYCCVIELQDVCAKGFSQRQNVFYISVRNQVRPVTCVGGRIEQYETHRNFRTYRICHEADRVEIILR